MSKRHRTCPVSGLPLAEIRTLLKTDDGRALDLDKVAKVSPDFAELRKIGETILVGFGDHERSINREMFVDRRAAEGRALPRDDGLRVNSSYHLVQVRVGGVDPASPPLILYATLPSSLEAGNGIWREVRANEKDRRGLRRGRG
jgi:hypothetical protein